MLFLLRGMAVKQTMNQEPFLLLFKREMGGAREKKKSPGEFKRLCGFFFVIFPLNKSAGRKAAKLHFIQLVWHQAPGQERKCTIKCDLLERQSRGCERKERKE